MFEDKQVAIKSIEEMDSLATEIAASLRGGEVLALSGELGAGKTTFVQGLAKALGVKQTIASPTFALERQYKTDKGFRLHHFDWYRLDDPPAVQALGVEELIGQSDAVVVVEWPERAWELLPSDTMVIGIAYDDHDEARQVTLSHRS